MVISPATLSEHIVFTFNRVTSKLAKTCSNLISVKNIFTMWTSPASVRYDHKALLLSCQTANSMHVLALQLIKAIGDFNDEFQTQNPVTLRHFRYLENYNKKSITKNQTWVTISDKNLNFWHFWSRNPTM